MNTLNWINCVLELFLVCKIYNEYAIIKESNPASRNMLKPTRIHNQVYTHDEYQTLREQFMKQGNDLSKLKQELERAQRERDLARDELNRRANHVGKKAAVEKERDDLHTQIMKLKSNIVALQDTNSRLESQLKTPKGSSVNPATLRSFEKSLQVAQEKVEDRNKEIELQKQYIAHRNASHKMLEDALEKHKAANQQCKERIEKMQAQHNELKQAHDGLKQAHSSLKQAHDGLKQAHSSLKQTHDGLKQAHSSLKQAHDDLKQAQVDARDSKKGEMALKLMPSVDRILLLCRTELSVTKPHVTAELDRSLETIRKVYKSG